MAKTLTKTEAPFTRNVPVLVTEENIAPWSGVARSLKWSSQSGWWIDIERPDGMTLVIHESQVQEVKDG